MQPSERNIVLGMPGYGRMTAAAGAAFYCASADMTNVLRIYQNGSLLASNFNQLWCAALNLCHQGKRIDYFAMLHDDVGPLDYGPDRYWLDMLIDELESKQLDVLSVVVPIKDSRGMTSMALQHPDDNWMPYARLSMHDVYELPETFTAEDVGRPLLLNTGCWVAKFNPEWAEQVHFSIEDRIVFNRAANRYQAQTVPEDWHFSMQLNSLGLKIGATRKIPVNHRGETDFTNTKSWGSHVYDSEAVKCSPVPDAFPHDIEGWLKPDEGKALAELARGKRVLEIGSFCGLSTVCMARTAEHVTAVDFFDGRATPIPGDTKSNFDANIARYGLSHKVATQHPAEPLTGEYDFIFIDGDHSEGAVRTNIEQTLAVLAPGGLIAFHDYAHSDPGVVAAVNEFIEGGATLIAKYETLAVVRPPAAIPTEV